MGNVNITLKICEINMEWHSHLITSLPDTYMWIEEKPKTKRLWMGEGDKTE